MIGLIIDGLVIYWAFTLCKKFHQYFLLHWGIFDKEHEYALWKQHRLPYLINKMKGDAFGLHYLPKIIHNPDPGYEKEIDKNMDSTWALAERLARSNHMRKDWNRFGPIEETQYDF